jgi:hypothetical protein
VTGSKHPRIALNPKICTYFGRTTELAFRDRFDLAQRVQVGASPALQPAVPTVCTLIAAGKTGRRARLVELDTLYVDRSIRRWRLLALSDRKIRGD